MLEKLKSLISQHIFGVNDDNDARHKSDTYLQSVCHGLKTNIPSCFSVLRFDGNCYANNEMEISQSE